MASADLRQELDCSICLTIYTDPVNLRCGHNFCRVCIDRVLDTQDGSGGYSCPECREEFQYRPTLQRNITLRNIVETFRSTKPDQETGIFCTYCIHSPVHAVISCLHCEASLCNDHLKVHSKSPEHVLTEPTTSMEKRKCSIHKELLKYYCTADATCICVSCSLAGEHQGHKVETMDEASERKKQKLRSVLQKMINMREETEKRVQSLRKCKGKVQEEVAGERERVTALITDLRRQLEDLEKRVLREISRQEERLLHPLSDLIQQLEIKKDHLSRKMGDIEKLCNMTDPLTVLQESHTGDLCDTEEGDNEDRERHDKLLHDGGGLDVIGISHILHTGLSDMMKGVNVFLNIQEAADILLDVNTAHNYLQISDDRKTASRSDINQNRPETPERFQDYTQVLSSRRFSSGRHYWEVDVRGSDWWFVGMSYPSIERRGEQSHIGMNKKSMASADLRQELDCSICLTIYTDPVNLRCGHNFCRVCIDRVLDTQDGSGGYSCPECREEFQDRPTLHRNITLRNIVETFRSTEPDQETGIFCTYCIRSRIPAVKSCLMCEASLCNDHLKVHSKSPEHVLTDPTTMEKRKCSVHKKVLEYYCTADAACICVSCRLDGEHQGHKVETLDEASERKKQKLRSVLQKMMNMREETEKRVQSLWKCKGKVQEEVAGERERVTALITDLRRQLEDLEKRVLREISRQEERLLHPLSDLIQQLEIKKDDLSRKMGDIEKLCNMTDPLTVLQESHTGDLCDTEEGDNEDRERHDKLLHDGGGLDVAGISHTLHTGLSDMMKGVNVFLNIQEVADILLDVNTANNYLQISDDRKTASRSGITQNRPETPERFQDYSQVLSSRRFSSGRHYWEVDVRGSGWWHVGMSYPSIERRGDQSRIGMNKKSWCVYRCKNQNFRRHDSKVIQLPDNISSNRVRIYLDYEAGKLSFYDLCDPIRHLHTFTTTFTEPLHAALCIYKGHIKICGQDQEM
ncbi:LOW QUALITY PROTEIN: E3 ubiquitin/ISG15 ligase TRIM25-like [Mantella aurantiaca]